MNGRYHAVTHFRFNFDAVLEAPIFHLSRADALRARLELCEGIVARNAGSPCTVATVAQRAVEIRRELERLELDEQIALAHEIADEARAQLELRLPIAEAIASGDLMDAEYPADLLDARRAAFVAQIETRNLISQQVERMGISTIEITQEHVENCLRGLWNVHHITYYKRRLQDEIKKERGET